MPSSHPIPSIAALALSLYTSDRRVERLPTVTEILPYESADFAGNGAGLSGGPVVMFVVGGDL